MSKIRKHLNNKNDNIEINEKNIIVKVIKPVGLNIIEVEKCDKTK
jgi:hypothetical protein